MHFQRPGYIIITSPTSCSVVQAVPGNGCDFSKLQERGCCRAGARQLLGPHSTEGPGDCSTRAGGKWAAWHDRRAGWELWQHLLPQLDARVCAARGHRALCKCNSTSCVLFTCKGFTKVKMRSQPFCFRQRGLPQVLTGRGDHTENSTGHRGCTNLACASKGPRGTKELWVYTRAQRWGSGWGVERNIFLAAQILLSILSLPCQNVYRDCKMHKPQIPPSPGRVKQYLICRKEQRDLQEAMRGWKVRKRIMHWRTPSKPSPFSELSHRFWFCFLLLIIIFCNILCNQEYSNML